MDLTRTPRAVAPASPYRRRFPLLLLLLLSSGVMINTGAVLEHNNSSRENKNKSSSGGSAGEYKQQQPVVVVVQIQIRRRGGSFIISQRSSSRNHRNCSFPMFLLLHLPGRRPSSQIPAERKSNPPDIKSAVRVATGGAGPMMVPQKRVSDVELVLWAAAAPPPPLCRRRAAPSWWPQTICPGSGEEPLPPIIRSSLL